MCFFIFLLLVIFLQILKHQMFCKIMYQKMEHLQNFCTKMSKKGTSHVLQKILQFFVNLSFCINLIVNSCIKSKFDSINKRILVFLSTDFMIPWSCKKQGQSGASKGSQTTTSAKSQFSHSGRGEKAFGFFPAGPRARTNFLHSWSFGNLYFLNYRHMSKMI